MLEAARPHLLRIQGPNCLGLMLPRIGLNASFSHQPPLAGDLAFLSQSGALITAIIDWARGRSIGFSHVVSLGDMADADFGDLLDYLAADAQSRAILLYMESVTHAPKFMSAARRAARSKPVIVVKTGRSATGARAALSHTGALAGADSAYEAAFRRAGVLRVRELDRSFQRGRNPRAPPPACGRPARHSHQRRRCRRARRGPAGRPRRPACDPVGCDPFGLGRGPAADLVARQSGRHHRRRRPGKVRPGARDSGQPAGCGRNPRHELSNRSGFEHRSGRASCGRPGSAQRQWRGGEAGDHRLARRRGQPGRAQAVRGKGHRKFLHASGSHRRVHATRALFPGARGADAHAAIACCGPRPRRRKGQLHSCIGCCRGTVRVVGGGG